MKRRSFALFSLFLLSACAPGATSTSLAPGELDQGAMSIFPVHPYGNIGDCMPYAEGDTMHVYYLHDAYTQETGFHDYWLYDTKNFYQYEDMGSQVPYVNDYSSQDLALGTGCVMKDEEGLYHCFYTGWNGSGNMPMREKIQHATSVDRKEWIKHPEHGFYGDSDDFRDPYVRYVAEDGCYWMLVATRNSSTGYIRLYKSQDLVEWTDHGIWFSNDMSGLMLECPSLLKYGDYWYLTFSEMGEMCTEYRYCRDILNPVWQTPERYYKFDGPGSYAGRPEVFKGRLFLYSWIGVKKDGIDANDFGWAGNMVCHELRQEEDGTLHSVPPREILEVLDHEVTYDTSIPKLDVTTSKEGDGIRFVRDDKYQYVRYKGLSDNVTKIDFSFTFEEGKGQMGLAFGLNDGDINDSFLSFNLDKGRLDFLYGKSGDLARLTPQVQMRYDFEEGKTYEATLLLEGDCGVLYFNDVYALSFRSHGMEDNDFAFFSNMEKGSFEGIGIYE